MDKSKNGQIRNSAVADLLRRYASTLRVRGENRFKVKAYNRAAESIELFDYPLPQFLKTGGDLQALPGVGAGIAGVVRTIVDSGRLPALERVHAELSPELAELSTIPSLDPKTTLRTYKKLGIRSLAELRARLESGEIEQALGKRIAFKVEVGLDARPRMLLRKAEPLAEKLLERLKSLPGVEKVLLVGSLRRKKDTIADFGFLVSGKSAAAIFRQAKRLGGEASETRTKTTASFKLSGAIEITLHWTHRDEWGWALIKATGSRAHWQELKAHAKTRKLALSTRALRAKHIDLREEGAIYKGLGVQFIEPELREGRGEVEAASSNMLPKLITLRDLRGDLHMHSVASDGANTIKWPLLPRPAAIAISRSRTIRSP